MNTSAVYALAICVVSVALEGIFAGGGIKRRLAELRVPKFVPPLSGWIAIGIFYYVICFVMLYRLFSMPSSVPMRPWALGVLGGLMFINALWNLFFFRTRNLFHAFVIGLPYVVLAAMLFGMLWRLDRPAAWAFLPYVIYLVYATRFGYLVWRLNEPSVYR
jgi:tryptophan-rich sensory protein